ncbi:MAG TPA: hypothetical protein VFQ61_16415 [Polyangiaceae bacterium]|nr:hypothetical protein [Polyangiaceae bacterium]
MASPRAAGQDVLDLLRDHGFFDDAARLERALSSLDSGAPQVRAAAQREILNMCHPRWLGDLYIEGLSLTDWSGKLDALSNAVQGSHAQSKEARRRS